MDGSYVLELFVALLTLGGYLASRREAHGEQPEQRDSYIEIYTDGISPLYPGREEYHRGLSTRIMQPGALA